MRGSCPVPRTSSAGSHADLVRARLLVEPVPKITGPQGPPRDLRVRVEKPRARALPRPAREAQGCFILNLEILKLQDFSPDFKVEILKS